jgi:hypothetical protein
MTPLGTMSSTLTITPLRRLQITRMVCLSSHFFILMTNIIMYLYSAFRVFGISETDIITNSFYKDLTNCKC